MASHSENATPTEEVSGEEADLAAATLRSLETKELGILTLKAVAVVTAMVSALPPQPPHLSPLVELAEGLATVEVVLMLLVYETTTMETLTVRMPLLMVLVSEEETVVVLGRSSTFLLRRLSSTASPTDLDLDTEMLLLLVLELTKASEVYQFKATQTELDMEAGTVTLVAHKKPQVGAVEEEVSDGVMGLETLMVVVEPISMAAVTDPVLEAEAVQSALEKFRRLVSNITLAPYYTTVIYVFLLLRLATIRRSGVASRPCSRLEFMRHFSPGQVLAIEAHFC